MPSEFDIIQSYFDWSEANNTIKVGIGDDAAVLDLSKCHEKDLVISVDTLISGVHFPDDTSATAIAHKALAVNLSDLAAMGAKPAWFTLALSLPESHEKWLLAFSKGLKQLANKYHISLIGGDTTKGPLSITIQVMGFVEKNKSLLRSKAKSGDKVYVSGSLGDAAIGLAILQNRWKQPNIDQSLQHYFQQALDYPEPQVALGLILRNYATACMDISDGFLQDLGHILKASQVGATIELDSIPLSEKTRKLASDDSLTFALTGGDDYQLLFTISPDLEAAFLDSIEPLSITVTNVGVINDKAEVITDKFGIKIQTEGYQHFHG